MHRGLRIWLMRSSSLSGLAVGSRAYVRFFYFFWSRIYDASICLDPAYRANARRLVERTVQPGDRVLDVGTGTGLLMTLGAARAREWVGLDYSGDMLARAARKAAARRQGSVALRWGDARRLPYTDGSFEVVLSAFMLPHFSRAEKPAVIREMARVLRPGGRLGLFLAQGELVPLFATRAELTGYLQGAGLTQIAIEDRDDVYRLATAVRPAGAG